MNISTRFLSMYGISKSIRIGIFLLLPLGSFAQTFFGVSSNPADNGTQVAATVAVTPPAAMQAGDLVVVFAHYRATSATLAISATGGQTWITEAANSGGTQTTRVFWCQFNGTWGADPSVTGGNGTNPLSVIMYVFRPSNPANAWDINVPQVLTGSNGATQTINGVTTTASNTVTMGLWASANDNTWGTLTGAGWSKTGLAAQYRNLGSSGQGHTAAYNIQAAATTLADVSQTQSVSLSTRKAIISWNEVPPPPNDDCANAIAINSSLTCVNTTGWLTSATYTAITGACGSNGGNRNDVWYSFVANTPTTTISLSAAPAQSSIQLFSGACGSLSSVQCAVNSTSLAASGLTVGATYYVRIWSDNNTAGTFDICIVNPPSNDDCSSAITLPLGGSCSNVGGSMVGATASAVAVAPCTGPVGYDVWYKFSAVNATATINLTSIGSGFTGARLQLFDGNCAGLTSLFCGTTTISATGLTAGATYYLRVYSTTAVPPSANGGFNICVFTTSPPPRFGNSYVNISKKTGGGVVEPGDTLEIRMTINHTSGTLYGLRYVDNIPSHTNMLASTNDSIQVITNEGLTFRSYTPAAADDAATYAAAPGVGEYNIRLNLGFGSFPPGIVVNNTSTESASATGRMTSTTDRPRGGGGLLFATSYRVVVTGTIGDTIRLNPGRFIYQTTAGGADNILTANPYEILISAPESLCANATGVNNAQEYGGSFGTGNTLNRSSDLAFPIPGYTYMGNVSASAGVGDGRYAIVKNISPRSGTQRNADRTPNCTTALPSELSCQYRMHNGHWDIDGDHTGTTDAIGNLPPADNQSSGYMLMVNADYVASETYRQTLTNLCPNTYYEFSAWIRNVCPTCGIDSTGATYLPRRPGVLPNLTFALDGVDRYSTGEVEASEGWHKKGFVFITGPSQSSATFSIRNNSQGGGGNDWVMDDISIATCLPTMSYSPSLAPNACEGTSLTIEDTIRSYFNNYTHYLWQKSVDNGNIWTSITAPTSVTLGPPVNGEYEFITSYTIPPANTTLADSGTLYRVLVATAASNLGNTSCQVTDGVSIINLAVIDCEPILDLDILSFNGILEDSRAKLSWKTDNEISQVKFIIERSFDGQNFSTAGELMGYNNASATNHYSFKDAVPVLEKAWYRIAIVAANGKKKYSSTIRLSNNTPDFELTNLINPFGNQLNFDISVTSNSTITTELVDIAGRTVLSGKQLVYAGTNSITLNNTYALPSGIYTLRVSSKDKYITRRVVKKN